MEKFFTIIGKVFLALLVAGVLAGGGYYVGTRYNVFHQNLSVTPTPESIPIEQNGLETNTTPAPTAKPTQLVQAGVAPSGGLSFSQYMLRVPVDWVVNHTSDETGLPIDTVTITKGDYQIKIFQAATGGAMCRYPGDPAFEGPSSTFDTYVTIRLSDGTELRRSGTITAAPNNTRSFTMCQKASDGTFQQPTPFGHVSYTTPVTPDNAVLDEMDGIIETLEKV